MTNTAPLSRAAPRPLLFTWFQEDGVTPIDCTGFTSTVFETDLPFAPTIAPVIPAQGQFRMTFTDLAALADLRPGRNYGVRVVLRDAANAPLHDFTLQLKAV